MSVEIESIAAELTKVANRLAAASEEWETPERVDQADALADIEVQLSGASEDIRLILSGHVPESARSKPAQRVGSIKAVEILANLGRKISVRRLQTLCGEGRVPGAEKTGGSWTMPRASLFVLAVDVRGPGGRVADAGGRG